MLIPRPYANLRSILLLSAFLLVSGCERKKFSEPQVLSGAPEQPAQVETAPPVRSYAEVVELVRRGVVTIRAEHRIRPPRQHPFLSDPLLRDFFGFGGTQAMPRKQIGLGSGVIVRPEGYILTSHHVVDGAEEIKIELSDHRVLDAKVVGSDPPSDLAVLKIEGKDLPALSLGDSDQVRVGDVALAVGNPLGIGQTVTAGIISAKGRSTGLSDGSFEDFLQTDAPINQGNSGGALVNAKGDLIGINSQILSPSGGNIGIGFAIPSNMARMVMVQLIEIGKVRRGYLGLGVQPITPELAGTMGLSEAGGVLVSQVAPDGPAARAGVRRGDVIVSFNGKPVEGGNELRNQVASTAPGSEVQLTVVRDGRERQIGVRLGEYQLRAEQPAAVWPR